MFFNPFQETLFDSCNDSEYDLFIQNSREIKTPYYSVDEFQQIQNDDFSVLHLNIRSLQKNFDSFRMFVNECKTTFDVICLSETWRETEVSNNTLYALPNYTIIELPRDSGKRGGGLLMYLSNNHSYSIRKKFITSNKNFESLFIEVVSKNKNIVVGVLYKPPNGKCDVFKNHLKSIIKKVNQEKKIFCAAGDFNINALTYDNFPKTKSFFDMLFKNNVISVINRPTRVTRSSATAIDNILTNSFVDVKLSSGIIKTDISDHFSIFYSFNVKKDRNQTELKTIKKKRHFEEKCREFPYSIKRN